MADEPSPPKQSVASEEHGSLRPPAVSTSTSSPLPGPLTSDSGLDDSWEPTDSDEVGEDGEVGDIGISSSGAPKRPRPSSEPENDATRSNDDKIPSADGAADHWAKRRKVPVSAIFIHAGAGYHSVSNERIHLEACCEAARGAMKLLRLGYSAVDAVEAAIKVLEDKEITNAGYGSNLSIDGTVECDATLVNHLGQSGACGAVPNVKNPISLAKAILHNSARPLSLRRIPPNLLVGDGARDFAQKAGVALVPNESLVSKNSRDRYLKWKEDLMRAEDKGLLSPIPLDDHAVPILDSGGRTAMQRDHTNAILAGTWNEGQPDSPGSMESGQSMGNSHDPQHPTLINAEIPSEIPPVSPVDYGLSSFAGPSATLLHSSMALKAPPRASKHPTIAPAPNDELVRLDFDIPCPANAAQVALRDIANPMLPDDSTALYVRPLDRGRDAHDGDVDRITDTVGAIAIDRDGNMAAGSSSGGIGMKHRGRIGPAALVGVGTAVLPAAHASGEGVAVAAVTSGTGEHITTTMASQKCAERLLHGTRRGPGGGDVPEPDERAALEAFLEHDFLAHPGVRHSRSAAALGVMAVKQCPARGYYLYFVHNTESFALVSMGSADRDPACVMSRLNAHAAGIALGARKISA
ncbi:N-terminal nucleophile aminohydrolase [Durotheca rogersii]|uniref:N-terminal nucleophile aminohydrolase n=1 Tax=Durotheca rogersii TaxID=419775 RepID=UPI00221F48E3|nr:N-terminal nucleophile aminohydrolase [Durotheca rogersii]KAI5860408.1 N-terminal nucleophile aminohydrolase [Durotheca rogersii]